MPDREIDTTSPQSPIETVGNASLIASDRVEGTPVYGADREKVGHVHNFMVNKRSGQVEHVIISDAGFFGLGASRYIPVQWSSLDYDPELGGYFCREITYDAMQEAGRESADEAEMRIW